MKLISGFLSLLLMLGIGGLLILKSPAGEPWLSSEDLVPDIGSIASDIQKQLQSGQQQLQKVSAPTNPATVYRWQDEQGNWQFSDTPPENITNVQQLQVDPDRNLIQGLTITEQEVDQAPELQPSVLPLPTTIPMGDIPKLIEDAKNIQKLVEERQQLGIPEKQ